MPESPAFEWVSAEMERLTSFNQLQARGTVRLALRKAGLEPGSVTTHEMVVVLSRVMPRELTARAIEGATTVCEDMVRGILAAGLPENGAHPVTAEDTFRRMFK